LINDIDIMNILFNGMPNSESDSESCEHVYVVGCVDNDESPTEYGQTLDVKKFVDKILRKAIVDKVDKLYFECFGDSGNCRCEKNSRLIREYPIKHYMPVLNRIKIIFGLDITESRVPQQWEPFYINLADAECACKAIPLTLPTVFGEYVIITFLYDLSSLGIGISGETIGKIRDRLDKGRAFIVLSNFYPRTLHGSYYSFMRSISKKKLKIINIDEKYAQQQSNVIPTVANIVMIPKVYEMPYPLNTALQFFPDLIMIHNPNTEYFDNIINAVLFYESDINFILSIEAQHLHELSKKCESNGIKIEKVIKDKLPWKEGPTPYFSKVICGGFKECHSLTRFH